MSDVLFGICGDRFDSLVFEDSGSRFLFGRRSIVQAQSQNMNCSGKGRGFLAQAQTQRNSGTGSNTKEFIKQFASEYLFFHISTNNFTILYKYYTFLFSWNLFGNSGCALWEGSGGCLSLVALLISEFTTQLIYCKNWVRNLC